MKLKISTNYLVTWFANAIQPLSPTLKQHKDVSLLNLSGYIRLGVVKFEKSHPH